MKYASIDIGTNTLRLLVAEPDDDGLARPLLYDREVTRLGGGYSDEKGLSLEAVDRTLDVLERFKSRVEEQGAELVSAVATSVVRRAVNRDWFTAEIRERTGIETRVIDGDEEARLSLAGVRTVLSDPSGRFLLMDIGGGSTEFIASAGGAAVGVWSMEMGVVHLAEKYLKGDPPSGAGLSSMECEIKETAAELKRRMLRKRVEPSVFSAYRGAALVGTAGTATTLAAIDQHLKEYERQRINNYVLDRESVGRIYRRLSRMRLRERVSAVGIEKGREDVIIPGAAIVLQVMEYFGFGSMVVSDAGLLEGIIVERLSAGRGSRE